MEQLKRTFTGQDFPNSLSFTVMIRYFTLVSPLVSSAAVSARLHGQRNDTRTLGSCGVAWFECYKEGLVSRCKGDACLRLRRHVCVDADATVTAVVEPARGCAGAAPGAASPTPKESRSPCTLRPCTRAATCGFASRVADASCRGAGRVALKTCSRVVPAR